jgi:prepilin-type N-terminal cleavage/methylation domain-containing protein
VASCALRPASCVAGHAEGPALRGRRAAARVEGFTLLELLITLSILGLVLTALYGTLVKTLELRDHLANISRGPREGLALLEVITADLRAAVLPPLEKAPFFARADRNGEGRDADQVTFLASVTSRFAEDPRRLRGENLVQDPDTEELDAPEPVRADLCEISYRLKGDPDHPGCMRLYRREDFHVDGNLREGGTYLLLHRRVAGFKLRWFRGDESETGRPPEDQWDAEKTKTVPQAALVELVLDVTEEPDAGDRQERREPTLVTYRAVVPILAGRLPVDPNQQPPPAGG